MDPLHLRPLPFLLAPRKCFQLKSDAMQIHYLWLHPKGWHRSTAILFIMIKQIHFLHLIDFLRIKAKARYFLSHPLCFFGISIPWVIFRRWKMFTRAVSLRLLYSYLVFFPLSLSLFFFPCWEQNSAREEVGMLLLVKKYNWIVA